MQRGRIARALAFVLLTFTMVFGAVTARAQSAADEKKIDELISKMTRRVTVPLDARSLLGTTRRRRRGTRTRARSRFT